MTEPRRSPPIPIRQAVTGDYDQIVEVWMSAGLPVCLAGRDRREAFDRQLGRFPTLYLVALDGDQIVGVVLGTHDERKGWINRLAVRPAYRRRGIAEALLEACDDAFRAVGVDIVAALIGPENVGSCALFERLGYRTDVPVKYYRKLRGPEV